MKHELCPKIESALQLLSKKWVSLIIYSLQQGPLKFSEIEKFIPGLSGRLLSERLKDLELQNLIKKNVISTDSVKITYELTRKGHDLKDSFQELEQWAQKWN